MEIRVSDNNKEKGSACGIVFIPQTEPCFIFYRPVSPERMARSHCQFRREALQRQVHLIVMALFALATVISILYLNFSGSLIIVALVFALLVLLIPYVMHYYLLENSVQKMYEQYDRMMNKIEPSFQVKPDDKK